MTDLRMEFYKAINKANTQKPKQVVKKFSSVKETVSYEDQIKNALKESSCVSVEEKQTDNQSLVDWLYNQTKKLEGYIPKNELTEEEIKLNEIRAKARAEYRNMMRMMERVAPVSAASAAAGAGAGGRGAVNPSTNQYVEDEYIDNYFE